MNDIQKLREIMEAKGWSVPKDDAAFKRMCERRVLGDKWMEEKFGKKALALYLSIGKNRVSA